MEDEWDRGPMFGGNEVSEEWYAGTPAATDAYDERRGLFAVAGVEYDKCGARGEPWGGTSLIACNDS